jgi:hypothetical protein
VALTRAMQSLTLSYCTGRKRYGQLLPCHPSRFLEELPPELVEDALDKRRWTRTLAGKCSNIWTLRGKWVQPERAGEAKAQREHLGNKRSRSRKNEVQRQWNHCDKDDVDRWHKN